MTKFDKTLVKYRVSQGNLKIELEKMDKHHYHLELIEIGNIHFTEHKYKDAQEEYLAAIYGYISDDDINKELPKDETYLLNVLEEWIKRIHTEYKEVSEEDKFISFEEIMIVLTSLIKFTESKKHTKENTTIEITNLYSSCLRIVDTSLEQIKDNNYRQKILNFKIRVLRSLADSYRDGYNYDQSINLVNEALELSYKHFNDKLDIISDCLTCKAAILSEHCEYDEAITLHKESLIHRKKIFGENHEQVASSMYYISMLLLTSGDYIEATKYSDECLNIRLQIQSADSPIIASSLYLKAKLLYLIGNYNDSIEIMKNSLTIRELKFGTSHASVAQSMSGLADSMQMKGEYSESLSLHKFALSIREKFSSFSTREVAQSYYSLGMNAFLRKDYNEAMDFFEKSLEIRESLRQQIQVGVHVSVIETNIAKGRLLVEQNQLDKAIPLLEEANKSLEKIFSKDEHPLMIESLLSLAIAMKSNGRHDYANECIQKANKIITSCGILFEKNDELKETNNDTTDIQAIEKEQLRIVEENRLKEKEDEEKRLKDIELQKQNEINEIKQKELDDKKNMESDKPKTVDPKSLTVEEELALKMKKLEEEEAAERAEAEKKKKEAIIKSLEAKITFILGKPSNNDDDWSTLRSYKETILIHVQEIYGADAVKKKEADIDSQIRKTEDARAEKQRQIEEMERKKREEEEAIKRKIEEELATELAEIKRQDDIKIAVENIRIALSKRDINLIEDAVAKYKLYGISPPAIEVSDATLLLVELNLEEKQKQKDAERLEYFEARRKRLEEQRKEEMELQRIEEEKQQAKENAIKKYYADQEKEERKQEEKRKQEREIKMKADADLKAKKETERLNKLPKIQREMIELRKAQLQDRDVFKVKSKLRLGIRKKDITLTTELSPLKVPAILLETKYHDLSQQNNSNSNNNNTDTNSGSDNHIAIDDDEVFHAVEDINLNSYDVISIKDVDRTIHKHHHDYVNDDNNIEIKLVNSYIHHSVLATTTTTTTTTTYDPIKEALHNLHNTFPQFTSSSSSLESFDDMTSIGTKSTTRSKIYPQLQVNILRKKINKK